MSGAMRSLALAALLLSSAAQSDIYGTRRAGPHVAARHPPRLPTDPRSRPRSGSGIRGVPAQSYIALSGRRVREVAARQLADCWPDRRRESASCAPLRFLCAHEA